jgi:hypothetical protein
MTDILLIDNSNVYNGLNFYPFQNARFDYLKFCEQYISKSNDVKKIIVGSTLNSSSNNDFWELMKKYDFKVITFERNKYGEKKVDSEIIAQGMDLIHECTSPGKFILLSGDEDMHPLVKRAHDRKWLVEVWSWKDSIKNEYAQSSDIDIVRFLDDLKYDFVFHKADDLEYNHETYREYCIREKEKEKAKAKEMYREYCASEKEREKEKEKEKEKEREKEKNQKSIFDNVAAVGLAAVGLAERGLSVLKSLKNRK